MAAPMAEFDDTRTIEALDGIAWPPPTLQSYVATTSYAIRRKRLRDLTPEELSLGLEQQIGLQWLVPLALRLLEAEPLTEARLYAGDLLRSLLEIPGEVWATHESWRARAKRVAAAAFATSMNRPPHWQAMVLPGLQEAHARFLGQLPSRPWLRPTGDAPRRADGKPFGNNEGLASFGMLGLRSDNQH